MNSVTYSQGRVGPAFSYRMSSLGEHQQTEMEGIPGSGNNTCKSPEIKGVDTAGDPRKEVEGHFPSRLWDRSHTCPPGEQPAGPGGGPGGGQEPEARSTPRRRSKGQAKFEGDSSHRGIEEVLSLGTAAPGGPRGELHPLSHGFNRHPPPRIPQGCIKIL